MRKATYIRSGAVPWNPVNCVAGRGTGIPRDIAVREKLALFDCTGARDILVRRGTGMDADQSRREDEDGKSHIDASSEVFEE